jgi:hypothetical protein
LAIYEMRTYTAAPMKIFALSDRFRDGTLELFEKHGFEVVGFWQPVVGRILDQLHYMLKWDDADQMQEAWGKFLSDPAWIELATASEVDGPLIARVDTELWMATDYSPQQ